MIKTKFLAFILLLILQANFVLAQAPKGLEIGKGLATTFAHGSAIDGCKADKMDQQNNQRSASGVILSR